MRTEMLCINFGQDVIHVDDATVAMQTLRERFLLVGDDVSNLVTDIIDYFKIPSSVDAVVAALSNKYSVEVLEEMLKLLIDKYILVEYRESAALEEYSENLLDKAIFYTLGGMNIKSVISRLSSLRVGIIGTNQLATHFLSSLTESKLMFSFCVGITDSNESNITHKDVMISEYYLMHDFTDLNKLIMESDFIIASSNYYDHQLFSKINEICYDSNKKWMRVVVDGHKAEIGPIMIPFETCCYACLRTRYLRNTNYEEYMFDNIYEVRSKQRMIMKYNSFHVLNAIVANISCMEMIKYYTNIRCSILGQILSIDCIDLRMQTDLVYRVYTCKVCGRKEFS